MRATQLCVSRQAKVTFFCGRRGLVLYEYKVAGPEAELRVIALKVVTTVVTFHMSNGKKEEEEIQNSTAQTN